MEQQIRAVAAATGRGITQFINDQQIRAIQLSQQSVDLVRLLTRFLQVHLSDGCEEADFVSLSAHGHSQRRRQVCRAGPAGTDEQVVLAPVEMIAIDELQTQWLVDVEAGREVELIEQRGGGEIGRFEPPLAGLVCSFDQLQLAELQEIRQTIDIVRG